MARVTTVATIRAIPGHEEDIVHIGAEQFARDKRLVPGRVDAQLYQAVDEPLDLLYVGRWTNKDAFEAFRQRGPLFTALGPHAQPSEVRIYEPLKSYVEMYAPSELLTAVLIDGARVPPDELLASLRAHDQLVNPREAGLVEYEAARGVEQPAQILVQARWRSVDAAAAHYAAFGRDFDAALIRLGATIRRFSGCLRARTLPP